MSGVEEIERAIQELSDDEFARIARRVHALEQERWDAEMDRDAVADKLDFLVVEARNERAQGYSRTGPKRSEIPAQFSLSNAAEDAAR
jgi:recombinational DNA repair ATPase RecF